MIALTQHSANVYTHAFPVRAERTVPSLPLWWSGLQRIIALFALAAILPLLAVLYVAVRATSPGPFLFRQQRPGKGGRRFEILKIRTMTLGAERRTALGVDRDNPSITPIGRILRELKLDELPQLWNVVRGDMVLVGPRPLPLALQTHLGTQIPDFGRRLHVRPGLSLISQVCLNDNGVDDELVADWTRRAVGERHYLRNRSVTYDAVVIGLTGLFVARRLHGALRKKAPVRTPARVIQFPRRASPTRKAA
jgi:lipopolysaccharide/colanic/teichoic acid biosynthesis glycosyltransferase